MSLSIRILKVTVWFFLAFIGKGRSDNTIMISADHNSLRSISDVHRVCDSPLPDAPRRQGRIQPAERGTCDTRLQVCLATISTSSASFCVTNCFFFFFPFRRLGTFLPLEARSGLDGAFVIRWSFFPLAQTLRINEQYDILLRPDAGPGHSASFNVTAITNVLDGVTLPYFNMGDAVILNNGIMPHATVLPLRLTQRSTSPTTTIYDIASTPPIDSPQPPPLLTITYASFPSLPTFDFPLAPYSVSPSTTLPTRRAIVGVLVPLAVVVAFAAAAAYALIKIILAGAMLLGVWTLLFEPSKFWKFWNANNTEAVASGEAQAPKEAGSGGSDVDEKNVGAAKIDSKLVEDMV